MENNRTRGTEIIDSVKVTKTDCGKSDMTSGNAYRITMTRDRQKITMMFNDNYLNKSDKKDYIYSLLTDAASYEDYPDPFDFMEEFGYNTAKEARKAYNGCKKQSERLHKLFTDDEIEALKGEFENY